MSLLSRDAGAAVGQRLAGVRQQARQVDCTIFGEGRGEGDGDPAIKGKRGKEKRARFREPAFLTLLYALIPWA